MRAPAAPQPAHSNPEMSLQQPVSGSRGGSFVDQDEEGFALGVEPECGLAAGHGVGELIESFNGDAGLAVVVGIGQ